MTGEQFAMDTLQVERLEFRLGSIAEGKIDPETRNIDRLTLEGFEQDVLGSRFDAQVDETIFLPCGCIDGRCPHGEEQFNLVPNAAGGTLSLYVGELLTNGSCLAASATNSEESVASLLAYLKATDNGHQIGGHTGPAHGSETASGCGANDALLAIFGQLVDKADAIRGVLEQLGAKTDGFADIVKKAANFRARPEYFASGKAVSVTLESESPKGNCPVLVGDHNELLIRLNNVEGTTIDRRAVQEEYGDDFQLFNVDVWALKNAAEVLSDTDEERDQKFAAMVAYQVATALQLCGPGMKVIVR